MTPDVPPNATVCGGRRSAPLNDRDRPVKSRGRVSILYFSGNINLDLRFQLAVHDKIHGHGIRELLIESVLLHSSPAGLA